MGMRSVPGAVATGSLSWRIDRAVVSDPVATAPGTDCLIVVVWSLAMRRLWRAANNQYRITLP